MIDLFCSGLPNQDSDWDVAKHVAATGPLVPSPMVGNMKSSPRSSEHREHLKHYNPSPHSK
jgi:hypothetical protein